ncbi:DUF4124 domain-containing protein [Shewanella bicestrii]|uniref:DUF4124 domain-containing protein n=1 Tax=Shewanella sp. GD03713 TaxID=2975372 RepID=UPI000B3431AF|nr:DUF4124 domain-containing protein [Shewanella sp. GD03713]MDH1468624.1 DUF4124 domain-containing protein [Shewanella sp. GD03713]QXN24780.1 DUF4124 domain-containing protein [Shewanella putrefaciens]VEE62338.1 Uncharacterised protein [Shewanella putrefaciens]
MRTFTLISLLLLSLFAQATVYKWVDKDGKVHYSDEPHPNAEVVELKEKTLNQIALPPVKNDADDSQVIQQIQYQVVITSPEEEETVRDNNGDFQVTATVTPEIKSQYLMALKLDGQTVGQPQVGGIFQLKNIDRGEHTIVVDAMTQNGKVFASSSPRKIFLHQAAMNPVPKKQPKSN